jgi:hypothetical protein
MDEFITRLCMYVCVQVLESRKAQFRKRVLDDYQASEAYKRLRSTAQRVASRAVLVYLLGKGGAQVQRAELKAVFVVGGEEKFEREHSPETDGKPIGGILDNDLQRILDRLIDAGFVKKYKKKPKSRRTKDRTKVNIFYAISPSQFKSEDLNTDEDLKRFDDILVKAGAVQAGPLVRTEVFRHELVDMGFPDISDKELEAYLQAFAKRYVHVDNEVVARWANDLPPEKYVLKCQLMKYIKAGGHVSRAYGPVE